MSELVKANYVEAPGVKPAEALEALERFLGGELPAFIVKQAGVTLKASLQSTGIGDRLKRGGYRGNVKETVPFKYKAHNILPADLTQVPRPIGEGWYFSGITPLHADQAHNMPLTRLSANLTTAGRAEMVLHQSGLLDSQEWDPIAQWDALDKATGNIIWDNLVDPALLNPEGIKATVAANDLLIFDASYQHMGRSIETPRASEAMFFNID